MRNTGRTGPHHKRTAARAPCPTGSSAPCCGSRSVLVGSGHDSQRLALIVQDHQLVSPQREHSVFPSSSQNSTSYVSGARISTTVPTSPRLRLRCGKSSDKATVSSRLIFFDITFPLQYVTSGQPRAASPSKTISRFAQTLCLRSWSFQNPMCSVDRTYRVRPRQPRLCAQLPAISCARFQRLLPLAEALRRIPALCYCREDYLDSSNSLATF